MRIIPAIDIIDGKCVRLTKGQYATKKIYNENPLEVAKAFEDIGIQYLHLVDLDGAKASHIVNYKILEQITSKTNLVIDFGGGVKSNEDVKIAFNSGASQITGGSIAVTNPQLFTDWIQIYGSEKIILGADVKNVCITINGWMQNTDIEIITYLKEYIKKGVLYTICTDVAKDGMLAGPSFDLYQKIITNVPSSKLIASGGVSSILDLEKLNEMNCDGAILGKAIYEQKIALKELESFILNQSSC